MLHEVLCIIPTMQGNPPPLPVRNTIMPATVGSQRCGAIGVLGEEIGPHNATAPEISLAEDHRAYPVSFVCPGQPLSAW